VRMIPLLSVVALLASGVIAAADPQAGAEPHVLKPGNGVTAPRLIKDVKPVYTKDAMDRHVQGTVQLNMVVLADGTVGDLTVKQSLDSDLDQQAIKAAKEWQFAPGTKDGKAVPVEVVVEMSFALRDGKPALKVGDEGVKAPMLVKDVKPQYTDDAKADRIQGTVELECVVETDGTVSNISVKKSLDPRLDEQARKALAQWQFKPGQKDGQDVRVTVAVELTFTLR
jgi:TonB family protein